MPIIAATDAMAATQVGTTSKLTVNATSTVANDTRAVTGYGNLAAGAATFTTLAPPATIEVKSGTRTATARWWSWAARRRSPSRR